MHLHERPPLINLALLLAALAVVLSLAFAIIVMTGPVIP